MIQAFEGYAGKRVLVTGATGFIAAHVIEMLAKAGATVAGVARQPPLQPIPGCTSFMSADLADLAGCRALIADARPAYVFHLASHVAGRQDLPTLLATFSANLTATVHLLTAIAEGPRPLGIVTAGSSEEPREFTLADSETWPYSPYAAAKLSASVYAAYFRRHLDLPISHARIFMTYGPRQRDLKKLVPYVALELLAGRAPALSSGARLADWVYVEDVAAGLLTLGLRPDVTSLDLGTGTLTSVGDVACKLRDIIRPGAELAFGATADRLNEPMRTADTTVSLRLSGWAPVVGLDEGLRRTANWYRTNLRHG